MGFFSDIIKGIGKLFNGILEPLLGWLVPKPPAKEGIKIDRQGSDNSIPIVYGTQKVGAIKVHKYVTDQAGGAKNEFLHLICVFAEGEVDAIEEVFFNGISENDTQWNKDGGGKWHRINRYIGSPTQTADSAAIAEIPNWTSLHTLSGLCYAYIRLELDKNQTVWRGEPQITARIRGRKLFDLRNSTTAYSENPALVLRDYLTNSIYGKGLNPARLDSASFISAANFCDTSVTNTVTRTVCAGEFDINDEYTYSCTTETVTESKALFSCNIFLDTGQTVFDNIKEILGTFRGIMPLSAGSIKLSVERDGDPVFNFNDGNIVGSIDVDSGSINDRYNRVEVRFPNEAKDFENDSVFYPPDDDALASQWLDEDNGVRLEQSFEFTGITKKDEAIQMAEIIAKKSRFTKSVGFESQPIGIVVEAGDIVSLTNTMHGWIEKPFRVIEKTINDDDTVKFALVEHEDAIYPFSGATFNELSGGTFLGDPTKIPAPTAPNLQPDLTLAETGLLTWSYENNAFIRSYEVEIASGGSLVLGLQSFGQSVIVPLLDSGSYVANIYAISSTGYRSPALAYSFNLTAPAQPSAITLTARDWEIDAQPVLAGIGIGTEFEFDIVQGDGTGYTPSPKAKGSSYTATGLLPNTVYTVFARAVNAFGTSSWVSESAITTNTGAQVDPYLDTIRDELDQIELINTNFDDVKESIPDINAILEELAQDTQEIFQRREDIDTESFKLKQEIQTITVSIDDDIIALNTRLNEVQADADGNATAISGLQLEVSSVQTGLSSTIDRVDQVEIDAEGNATAISSLQLEVDSVQAGLGAALNRVDQVEIDVDGNATAISALQLEVDSLETGLSATIGRVDSVEIDVSGNATALSVVQGQVNDPANNTSALYNFTQQAQSTADGAVNSITNLESRVEDNEDFAAAQLILNSSYNAEFDTLGARAFLGTDVNNRVTGVFIDDDGVNRRIEFVANSVAFVDGAGTLKVYYDLANSRYVFDGHLQAASGTFTGNLSAAGGTFQGTLSGANGTFTGTLDAGTVSGGTVTGSLVRTAASGSRVELKDDGTYLVWGGDGAKNDGNAAFFVKKNGSAKFAGDISGSSGTFNGTVKAENIIGETVGGAIVDINRTFAPITNGAEERILNMSIAPSAIARDIIIPSLLIKTRSLTSSDTVGLIKIKVNGVLAKQQSIPIPSQFGDETPDSYLTSRQFGVELPASASSASVEVYIQVNVNLVSIGINGSDSVVFAVSKSEEITILSP
jgi:predicted phage tail protein